MPKETNRAKPSNEQLVAENFPASVYLYLLNTKSLLASENGYLKEANAQSISLDAIIISEKNPEVPKITVLHSDTARNLLIDNKPVIKLTQNEISTLIHEKFPDDASAILGHYSQVASYFVSTPVQHILLGTEGVAYRASAATTHDNLFNSNGVALRETSQSHVYISVPSDKSFLIPDKQKQINAIPDEKADQKKREETKWRAVWRLKYNIKIVNRATPDGFEMLAIGTDSALISNILMNRGDPLEQLKDIVFKIREMEKSMRALHKSLQNKADSARVSSNPERQKNASDKAEIAKLVLDKITEFKSGEINFDMLVKNLEEFYQLSKLVKKAGVISKRKDESEESPTAKKIGAFVRDLTAIKAGIDNTASPTLQAAPVVNVKNNIHASIRDTLEVVRFYNDNRADNLSLLSKFFDSNRGMFRAQAYITLLEAAQSELSQAIIISAILKGGGTELKNIVTKSFGSEDVLKVQSDLMNLIQKSLQGEFIMGAVRHVIDSIVTTADSNKRSTLDDFKEELTALHSFEIMEKPEATPARGTSLK
jgi:hypothetical protein